MLLGIRAYAYKAILGFTLPSVFFIITIIRWKHLIKIMCKEWPADGMYLVN